MENKCASKLDQDVGPLGEPGSASTSEDGTLPEGVLVSLLVKDESVAIKDIVLGVLLLSWNEYEICCHVRSMNECDHYGVASRYLSSSPSMTDIESHLFENLSSRFAKGSHHLG